MSFPTYVVEIAWTLSNSFCVMPNLDVCRNAALRRNSTFTRWIRCALSPKLNALFWNTSSLILISSDTFEYVCIMPYCRNWLHYFQTTCTVSRIDRKKGVCTMCVCVCVSAGRLAAKWNVPVLTAGGSGQNLGDKAVFSTLTRLSHTMDDLTRLIKRVLKSYEVGTTKHQ